MEIVEQEDPLILIDDEQEGMTGVLNAVASVEIPVTKEAPEAECARAPRRHWSSFKWKNLYRAQQTLTEDEAQEVVSIVAAEIGCEVWKQLKLRFEPESDAQKTTVLLEFLYNIPAASTINETK